jgi:DNA repair protein RecN (Recombination protein N)
LDGPTQSIREAAALVADAAAELGAYLSGLESDPDQLAAVEARRAELGRLIGRYGASVDEVLAWEAAAAAELGELGQVEVNIAARAEELGELRAALAPLAQQCHEIRQRAAAQFAQAVTAELSALAMPAASVSMDLTATPDPEGLDLQIGGDPGRWRFNRTGCDDATIMLVPGPGAPKRPVAQGASGGELSRIMLAIHVVLAGADPVPTMVFDEVDAGVGGAAALEVGRRLALLARTTQVLVVTHLAQVAAFADQQLVVTRSSDDLVTESSVVAVTGQDRVREIARMLSGQPAVGAALAHAQELLASARAQVNSSGEKDGGDE